MVGQPGVEFPHGGQQPGHGHRRRALDVVVERAVLVAVLLQEAERVVVAEVLELLMRSVRHYTVKYCLPMWDREGAINGSREL